ncbi:MAG TPA: hypothetical protein VGN18_02315 [Jatrophihabitans sp.]|uniref:hypothetical protein n=1 Tax=Jatrophihabitans sp. TaxID=1932789 RepID=UPI002DF89D69|nr:hypothetical protein [Jatrophihabitans sp.]
MGELWTLMPAADVARLINTVGPVPAEVARRLADDPANTWRRLLTDPSGQVLETSPNHELPTAMARFVKDRDTTCRFPGCRAGWSAHRTPDGVTHWTSPTGRRFDKPPDELPIDTTLIDRDVPAPF